MATTKTQPFRILRETPQLATSTLDLEVFHIVIEYDVITEKDVVLWKDIQKVYKNARHIRNGPVYIPFLRDSSFNDLNPLRIQAIPETVLDIILEDTITDPLDNLTAENVNKLDQSSAISPTQTGDNDLNSYTNVTIVIPVIDEYTIHDRNKEQLNMDSQDNIPDTSDNEYEDLDESDGEYDNELRALRITLKAANQGQANAQLNIGLMYDNEQGATRDKLEAMEWYLKAAEQGHANAQFNVGKMYHKGQGVPQDYSKAMEWFLKAAKQGNSNAQFGIGLMYNNGQGVTQDHSKAMEWYLKAAEQGHADAQYNVGCMYRNGNGVQQDYLKAMEWFLKAAKQGNSSAQFGIGLMYDNGQGVPQDYSKAME
ncbi:hypothetical protein BGZ76_006060, partial [Entomortierella beljakovae]